jgi:hypothetical protein
MLVQKISPWVLYCTFPEWFKPLPDREAENFTQTIKTVVVSMDGELLAVGFEQGGAGGPLTHAILVIDCNAIQIEQIGRHLSRLIPTQPPPDFSVSEANSSSDPFVPLP